MDEVALRDRETRGVSEAFASVLEAARAGAEWAWSRLYAELARPVLGYLRLRGAVEPEDLLGEVFLQVARNIGTFDGDAAGFRSWVFTIAHHRIIDERRRRARRPVDPVANPAPGDALDDVEAEALGRLGTRWAMDLLDRLTPTQREVLLLRVVGDLSVDQIAQIVRKRPGAVKALQRRGLDRLRRELAAEGVPT